MKVKHFKDKISKGLGSAILFLKDNPGEAHRYDNTILWACCHNTKYDSQCETDRGQYLYEAICLSSSKDKLEDILLEKLLQNKKYWDVDQLFDIAVIMYENGNTKAKETMYSKFRSYLDEVLRIKVYNRYRLEAATAGAVAIIDMDGFDGLEFVADIMGRIMISTGREEIFDTDWIISHAENELGEVEVKNFFGNKSLANENIKTFIDEYNSHIVSRHEYQQNRKKELPDYETIISIVDEYCSEEKMRLGRRNILRRLGKKANKKELIKVANELENTTDEIKQIALLHVFINAVYPLRIDFLLNLSYSNNKELAGAAATALENIKDNRIHDLALDLIKDKELSVYALGLLKLNFENDFDIVLDLLKSEYERLKIEESEFDFHSLTMGVREIFEYNKSIDSIDILLFLYHNTTCSYCRTIIVEIMCNTGVLPDNIAEECQYDCVLEIREMATKHLKMKKYDCLKTCRTQIVNPL
ncbi:MAG: hypothetical protein GX660_28240 [Clostridiaceae bacterium]|nr:hypothetical protein [Clostridiaceae bacterium]